jgi:hypothetical protein
MLLESNQVGVRESLADLIACVESDSTPYTSMLEKRKKPINVVHSWQVKAYPDIAHSGVPDGKPASDFAYNPRTRLYGVVQKFWHNPAVSDFAEEVEVAGAPQGEMEEQVADSFVMLARTMEKRFLSNNDCLEESQPGSANETRGIFQWLQSTAQATFPIPAPFLPNTLQVYTGTLANFTEAQLVALASAAYINRKKKIKMSAFVGVDLKTTITGFSKYDVLSSTQAPIRRFNQTNDSKAMIAVVDRVVLDTCEIDLFLSSFLYTTAATGVGTTYTNSSGVFIDMEMAALHYMRLPRVKPLPYDGSGYKAIVDAMALHVIDNPLGMFSAVISEAGDTDEG